MRALCDFAVKLTHAPASIKQGDVDALRAHGWSDEAVHDAIQVIAYFNYVNASPTQSGSRTSPTGARNVL